MERFIRDYPTSERLHSLAVMAQFHKQLSGKSDKCSPICRLPAYTIALRGYMKAGAAMEFSPLFDYLKAQIEKNWKLMDSTVIQNQLQQLMDMEKITAEEYKALMQFFNEQYHTRQ